MVHTNNDTIPDFSNISAVKYVAIAKLINNDDSIIAEWEWNRQNLVIIVGIRPNSNPIPIDSRLSAMKFPIIKKGVAPDISCVPVSANPYIV